jgi:polysaccharide pyruvyl transferase WcaK-like protein
MTAVKLKKIPYCGVGVGILERLPRPPVDIIETMSWIGLRSRREFQEMKDVYKHVHFTADIAYAAPNFVGDTIAKSSKNPGIVLIPASVGELGSRVFDTEFINGWIRQNLAPLIASGSVASVLLLQPGNLADEAICRELLLRLRAIDHSAQLIIHSDAIETLRLISESDLVLSDRLHGAIVAHLTGVPFRLSKHHEKCKDFLIDVGHPDATHGSSYVDDIAGGDFHGLDDWTSNQANAVRELTNTASNGIRAWLEHLEGRVN